MSFIQIPPTTLPIYPEPTASSVPYSFATTPSASAPSIVTPTHFLSEERIFAPPYFVKKWIITQYDQRLRELVPVFAGPKSIAEDTAATDDIEEVILTLPQINEILRQKWNEFYTLRRQYFECIPRTGVPNFDADGHTTATRQPSASDLEKMGGDFLAFKILIETPEVRWYVEKSTNQLLTTNSHAFWLNFCSSEGIRRNFKFLGIMTNQLGTREDMYYFPGERAQMCINVQVGGPCEMMNYFGTVYPKTPLEFVLTRRHDGARFNEYCVVPRAGEEDPIGVHRLFDDVAGRGIMRESAWNVGFVLDPLNNRCPRKEEQIAMTGIATAGFSDDLERRAFEMTGRVRSRVKVNLTPNEAVHWLC